MDIYIYIIDYTVEIISFAHINDLGSFESTAMIFFSEWWLKLTVYLDSKAFLSRHLVTISN